jgi:SAM-dependent methyltransferase
MGEHMVHSNRDALREAYDGNVAERDARTLPRWRGDLRAEFLERLRYERLTSLLEIGAGVGRDARFFADHGCCVTCVDLSPEMIACCRGKGLTAYVMDVSALTFSDRSFDAAYSVNCLLHLTGEELPSALQEIRRVLRPGGLFYYGTWGGFDQEGVFEEDHLTPPRLFAFRTDERLQSIVGDVFEIEEFHSMAKDPNDARFRFQSLVLRKPAGASNDPDREGRAR